MALEDSIRPFLMTVNWDVGCGCVAPHDRNERDSSPLILSHPSSFVARQGAPAIPPHLRIEAVPSTESPTAGSAMWHPRRRRSPRAPEFALRQI
jgi:hypothetical protein